MKSSLNLQDTTWGTSPRDRQSSEPENAGDIHTTTNPSISVMDYGCAKIQGHLDGSTPSDGMHGKR